MPGVWTKASSKIHLKLGVNRVLFRGENGHAQTEFSLAICVW